MKRAQFELFRKQSLSYGGSLLKTRKGRAGGRPLDTRGTMHLVLRSSLATGPWSFRKPENEKKVKQIIDKFARRNAIRILSIANVGNHLHLHVKLNTRHTYKRFIRAITAAIAMAITGGSRWVQTGLKFWDRRPFSRVVHGLKNYLGLRDYILVNQLEGLGYKRNEIIEWRKSGAG